MDKKLTEQDVIDLAKHWATSVGGGYAVRRAYIAGFNNGMDVGDTESRNEKNKLFKSRLQEIVYDYEDLNHQGDSAAPRIRWKNTDNGLSFTDQTQDTINLYALVITRELVKCRRLLSEDFAVAKDLLDKAILPKKPLCEELTYYREALEKILIHGDATARTLAKRALDHYPISNLSG